MKEVYFRETDVKDLARVSMEWAYACTRYLPQADADTLQCLFLRKPRLHKGVNPATGERFRFGTMDTPLGRQKCFLQVVRPQKKDSRG